MTIDGLSLPARQARLKYDSMLNLKREREEQWKEMDSGIRDMKERLLAREEFARTNAVAQKKAKQELEEEVKRLRADGRKRQKLDEDRADPGAGGEGEEERMAKQAKLDKSMVVTVKWKKKHGSLGEALLRSVFSKYGLIDAVVLKGDKAVVNYKSSSSARAAFFSHGEGMDESLGIKVKLFWTGSEPPVKEASATEEEPVAPAAPVAPVAASEAEMDYESITMMNMRRAAERQRLIAQMEAEDEL